MAKKRTIFLTGATGLLGSYCLKTLLHGGHRIFCLARSKKDRNAEERVIDLLKFWDKKACRRRGENLVVLEGDIVKKNLGLLRKDIDTLRNEIEEVFHCAAVTEFNWPLERIRNVNVMGTRNVLDFFLDCKALKKINHISTAYVCGGYSGAFNENDLDLGQGFTTTYTQSKFEAEKLIEKYRKEGVWVDVFRPPLIVGESSQGKTPTFHQLFYQMLYMWSLEIFDIFPGKGIAINIAPVDTLSESILKISFNEKNKNKTYHPFSSQVIPLEKVLNLLSKVMKFKKPTLVPVEQFVENNLTPAQRMLLHNSIFYFNPHVKLDSSVTTKVLKKLGFKFSRMNDSSLERLMKYPMKNFLIKR